MPRKPPKYCWNCWWMSLSAMPKNNGLPVNNEEEISGSGPGVAHRCTGNFTFERRASTQEHRGRGPAETGASGDQKRGGTCTPEKDCQQSKSISQTVSENRGDVGL